MRRDKRPSLYRKENNRPPSLYRKEDKKSSFESSRDYKQIIIQMIVLVLSKFYQLYVKLKKNPKLVRNIAIALIAVIVLGAVVTHDFSGNDEMQKAEPATVLIGNNTTGLVYKEGPFGNNDSDVSIAYILGVHPRESGAHQLMEKALKQKADTLNCTYYLYKINVTSEADDFSQSRMNGQLLAQKYAVPDIINNNFTFAVDVHYSNGYWNVSRFIFTPNENNTLSNELGHAICDNFEWITYYVPPDPTSPEYVTGPLNDGGVGAIIYEAYTEDDNNVTFAHDEAIIDYIDNWNFTGDVEDDNSFFIF